MSENNEEILDMDRSETSGSSASAAVGDRLYPLDWETQRVWLKSRKFSHTLRRPTSEEILECEEQRHREIPIGKDNTVEMPDPTEGEDIDAGLYDKLQVEATGYGERIPAAHKAAAVNGLYRREIHIDEDTDIFADEVPVLEEIGQGDEPDFVITHVFRQPDESELKRFRKRSSGGKLKPGKRGRQNFVPKSNLKEAIAFYDQQIVRVEGAALKADPNADALALVNAVDPLIKRRVVEALVAELAGNLLD